MTVRADTLAVVDDIWRSASDTALLVGMWAKMSVNHALNALANEGVIERKSEPMPSWTISLYRRKQESGR